MTTLIERPEAPTVRLRRPQRDASWRPAPAPKPPKRARHRRPEGSRFSSDTWIVLALLVVVLGVQAWNITGFPPISADEGTYLAQAWAVARGDGLAHYTYWYDHPPLGWMQIALLSWLPGLLAPGALAVAGGRLIMLVVTGAAVVLLYKLGDRLDLPRWASVLAVLLYGLSPLAVIMHRQIYLDNVAVVWMLAAMVLALSPRRHLWHHVAAGICVAVAVLSKETMLLVFPAVLIALWRGTHKSTRTFSLVGFGSGLVLVGSFYPLYALIKGELFPGRDHVSLLGAIFFQLGGREGSGSVFTPGSSAYITVGSWLYYDKVLIFAGLAAALAGLFLRRLWVPAVAVLLLAVMVLRPGGYLPSMYIIQALPFLALSVAGMVDVLADRASRLLGNWQPVRRKVVIGYVAMVLAGLLAPVWWQGNAAALTRQDTQSYRDAVAWIGSSVQDKDHKRIVVDDGMWLDMVKQDFRPGTGAIWFYKIDLDPEVMTHLPGGWRDIDYVVSTPMLRDRPDVLPTVTAALAHSRVLATFGEGDNRVEIRQITT
ncbi:phospholipid carrier-dependent glycosyltransferase [Pseudonocardiaceae bacterium YIM PH 21723]|nr:phospholipid carrier-dependent glycosyltransferase [Pseudonocardiaceae bacterium YIM PH 21723]